MAAKTQILLSFGTVRLIAILSPPRHKGTKTSEGNSVDSVLYQYSVDQRFSTQPCRFPWEWALFASWCLGGSFVRRMRTGYQGRRRCERMPQEPYNTKTRRHQEKTMTSVAKDWIRKSFSNWCESTDLGQGAGRPGFIPGHITLLFFLVTLCLCVELVDFFTPSEPLAS